MKPFSLLIKPAGADCNLACAYCFYLGRRELYPESRSPRMSPATLEALVKGYLATEQPQYAFAWQGGEPALMGLEFYARAVELQKKHGRPGASVANHFQTNCTCLSPELVGLFARYNFLVGVSLDGPAAVHDAYRRRPGGEGSHARVMAGLRLLRANQVKTNILTLVSRANVARGPEVYRYLRGEGFAFHQYIPCVEFDSAGRPRPYAVTAGQWGDFLCAVFDEWSRWDVGRVSVRYFDALLNRLVTGRSGLCQLERNCCQYLVVEHNGDVYPCDFFVAAPLRLGNLHRDSWETLRASPRYAGFGAQKAAWHPACAACRYLPYCAADCLKHRLSHGSGTAGQKSWLCQGYQRFLAHALPKLNELARAIGAGRGAAPAEETSPARASTPGRNDPCPCGSGKKYKKCCGR